MASSQNGYPANDRGCIHTVTVPGTSVQLPVRKGPAGDLLIWAAARWHREVEPLTPGWCWGYAERTIRGSSTELSNHASGTAIDLNAPAHPLGTSPSANFSPQQIDAIHRIVADSRGCVRWGGDYTGRKDGMHLEIVASEAACASVLAQSPGNPEDELTPEQNAMLVGIYHQMSGSPKPGEWPGWPSWGGGTQENLTLLDYLRRNNVEVRQLVLMVDALRKDIEALKQKYGA